MSLEAGRELDKLVAEKVMDLNESGGRWYKGSEKMYFGLPPFSTDMSAVWEVVTELAAKGHYSTVSTFNGEAFAGFIDYNVRPTMNYAAVADTAPLAICLAALAAKGCGL